MPVYEIEGKRPRIGIGTWVAPSAEIIGDVEIGENCYIGFGAVIRGDFGKIKIGNESLVEEGVVIQHSRADRNWQSSYYWTLGDDSRCHYP